MSFQKFYLLPCLMRNPSQSCLRRMSACKGWLCTVSSTHQREHSPPRVPGMAWCEVEREGAALDWLVNWWLSSNSEKACGRRAGKGCVGTLSIQAEGIPVSYLWHCKDFREEIFDLPNAALRVFSHQRWNNPVFHWLLLQYLCLASRCSFSTCCFGQRLC